MVVRNLRQPRSPDAKDGQPPPTRATQHRQLGHCWHLAQRADGLAA